jgi:hypothetical protein
MTHPHRLRVAGGCCWGGGHLAGLGFGILSDVNPRSRSHDSSASATIWLIVALVSTFAMRTRSIVSLGTSALMAAPVPRRC